MAGDIRKAEMSHIETLSKQIESITESIASIRDIVVSMQISQAAINEQNSLLRQMVIHHEETLVGTKAGDGLVYQVASNTKFQSTVEKVWWIVITPFLGVFGVGIIAVLIMGFIIIYRP